MNRIKINSFPVIGIAVKTTNENQKSATDIASLWERFFNDNIKSSIPNKLNDDIYCIYTAYEGDFTKPYTTLIGCRVSTLENILIPEDMEAIIVEEGEYIKYATQGKLSDGIVIKAWNIIWNSDIDRTYKTDYELYHSDGHPDNAKVDIFVGVR